MAKYRYYLYKDDSLVREIKGKNAKCMTDFLMSRDVKDMQLMDLGNKGVIRGTDENNKEVTYQYERYKG